MATFPADTIFYIGAAPGAAAAEVGTTLLAPDTQVPRLRLEWIEPRLQTAWSARWKQLEILPAQELPQTREADRGRRRPPTLDGRARSVPHAIAPAMMSPLPPESAARMRSLMRRAASAEIARGGQAARGRSSSSK